MEVQVTLLEFMAMAKNHSIRIKLSSDSFYEAFTPITKDQIYAIAANHRVDKFTITTRKVGRKTTIFIWSVDNN